MKPKHIFIFALVLLSQKGFGQYFNHQVPNYYFDFNGSNAQSITPNRLKQIVFISVNQGSPNFPNDIELIKLDQRGLY